MGASTTRKATISSGQSLSNAIGIGKKLVTGFNMPADWSAANLTFTGAEAGGTHQAIKDSDGNELTVTAAEDIFISLTSAEMDLLSAPEEIKVRSGTSGSAVAQGADRVIMVVLK